MISSPIVDRQSMIEDNTGLVHSCAHRFKGRGIEYEDLFQAGCIGLIKAADGFDFDRGVRFSTYAVPVILGEMRRLFRDGGAVKISRSIKELSIKIARFRQRFTNNSDREPTITEIANSLEVDEEAVVEALNVCAPPISLTESEDSGGGQLDIPIESTDELVSDLISLRQVVSTLCDNDRKIIVLRYFCNKTQAATAKDLGMTQVQVSRREKKILSTLRGQLLGTS